jgi:hypothetical protein
VVDVTVSGYVQGVSTPDNITVTVGGVVYPHTVVNTTWSIVIDSAVLDALTPPIDVTINAFNDQGVSQISRQISTDPPEYEFLPADLSVLEADNVSTSWNQVDGETYKVTVGTTRGGTDIFDSGTAAATNTITATGLPSDGSVIYMRLTIIDGAGPDRYVNRDLFSFTSGTDTPTVTTTGLVHGAPLENILPGTALSLTSHPTITGPYSYDWRRVLPTVSDTAQATTADWSIDDTVFTTPNLNLTFRLTITGAGTGPAGISDNLKTRLLNMRQYGTTTQYARAGFGQNTTGGTNVVTVFNRTDFLREVNKQYNFVVIDSSANNDTWVFDKAIGVEWKQQAPDVTVYGGFATGLIMDNTNVLAQSKPERDAWDAQYNVKGGNPLAKTASVTILADNIILHGLNFRGQGQNKDPNGYGRLTTCIAHKDGSNTWLDHLTFDGFAHDDSYYIGSSSDSQIANNVTISSCWTKPGAFGCWTMVSYRPNDGSQVTIHNCRIEGEDRSTKNDGGQVESSNNVIRFVESGTMRVWNKWLSTEPNIWSLSRSNYYDYDNATNKQAELVSTDTYYVDGNSIYTGLYTHPDVTVGMPPGGLPYTLELIDPAVLRTYVDADAGAHANIDYTPVGGGTEALTEFEDFTINTGAVEASGGDTVCTVIPVVSGCGYTGRVLSCSTGTWNNATGFTYQWTQNGTAISGETGNTYTVAAAYNGEPMSCSVTSNAVTATATGVHHWIPTDGTVSAWYDPADSTTITESGGTVTDVADLGPGGHDLAQGTVARQATYVDPYLELADDTYLGTTGSADISGFVMCALYDTGVEATFSDKTNLFVNSAATTTDKIQADDGTALWNDGSITMTGTTFINGSSLGTLTALPWPKRVDRFAFEPASAGATTWRILHTTVVGRAFPGKLYEFVAYPNGTSAADIEKFEAYVMCKNNITPAAGHMYEFTPPDA